MNDIEKAIEVLEEITMPAMKMDAIHIAVQALEEKLSGGWIPVSERLPKEDEEVLVTTIGNQVCWAFRYLDEWNTCLSTFENEYVLAWMPLPEPYREVEDERFN